MRGGGVASATKPPLAIRSGTVLGWAGWMPKPRIDHLATSTPPLFRRHAPGAKPAGYGTERKASGRKGGGGGRDGTQIQTDLGGPSLPSEHLIQHTRQAINPALPWWLQQLRARHSEQVLGVCPGTLRVPLLRGVLSHHVPPGRRATGALRLLPGRDQGQPPAPRQERSHSHTSHALLCASWTKVVSTGSRRMCLGCPPPGPGSSQTID